MPITMEITQPADPSGPIMPTPGPEIPSDPVREPASPSPTGPIVDDPAPDEEVPSPSQRS